MSYDTSSVCCGICGTAVLSAESIFFYEKGEGSVHIAVKPEHEARLRGSAALIFEKLEGPKSKWKPEETRCAKCQNGLGGIFPLGPGNCNFVAFGSDWE